MVISCDIKILITFSLLMLTTRLLFRRTLMIGMSCLLQGVGGVLFVCRIGADLPVPYFSRQTKLHEEKYSATIIY